MAILRPLEANDREKIIDMISEPKLRRLTGSIVNDEQANAPFPPEEVARIKEWYKSRNEQTDRLDLGIVRRDNEELDGFKVLGLHKVELGVCSFNPRVEEVYRKNGFVLEGIQREAIRYNNNYFDTKILAC